MILVNGEKQEHISIKDRAIHYGDGVFETIAINNGTPLAWQSHMLRLQEGCLRLGIDCPSENQLYQESLLLCSDQQRAVLKLIISRGEGGRGYAPPDKPLATRVLITYPWPDYPAEYAELGIKAGVCETRLSCNTLLAGIKHLNRLEQVMLKKEIGGKYPEALVLDTENRVIEGIMSNVFIVEGEHLITPDLERAGVNGVIRSAIIELAKQQGLGLEITDLYLEAIVEAEEVFFCNSIAGIWPVIDLQGRSFKTATITRKIQKALLEKGMIAAP